MVAFKIPKVLVEKGLRAKPKTLRINYSTVTDLARLRGWSTLQPRRMAIW